MEKYFLPKKTQTLWQIRAALLAALLTGGSLALLLVSFWFLLAAAFFAIASLLLIFFYIPAFLKSYEIIFGDGSVLVYRGVFIRTTHIMPFSKMIYAETFTTPLALAFKLSAITLKAARSRLLIPEIEADGAKSIVRAVCGEELE